MITILIGMKHCGKSTQGRRLARALKTKFVDTDDLMSTYFELKHQQILTAKEIFAQYGKETFHTVEEESIRDLMAQIKSQSDPTLVLALGGATPTNEKLMQDLKTQLNSRVIFLNPDPSLLFERVKRNGPSRFLQGDNPEAAFLETYRNRLPLYETVADFSIGPQPEHPDEIHQAICQYIKPCLEQHKG